MHTLSLTFNLQLDPQHIRNFRAAIIEHVGIENQLFHNRDFEDDEFGKPIERYPLIQYRLDNKHAQIWAMNEGVAALKKVFKKNHLSNFSLMGREEDLSIISTKEIEGKKPAFSKTKKLYYIQKFLPFNLEKRNEYDAAPYFKDKIKIIEQLLLNEIILFSYASAWQLSDKQEIKVQLHNIDHISNGAYTTYNRKTEKHIKMHYKAFNLSFYCNADLPPNISLGRHKAYGYGIVNPYERA